MTMTPQLLISGQARSRKVYQSSVAGVKDALRVIIFTVVATNSRSKRPVLLALLVLTAVASASWALWPRDAATVVRTTATEISVTRSDGGLQLTLRTLRGPYFVKELLPVTLVLT